MFWLITKKYSKFRIIRKKPPTIINRIKYCTLIHTLDLDLKKESRSDGAETKQLLCP